MCQSCEMLNINGLNCHEQGCPDAWRDAAPACRECGQTFKPESSGQRECSPCCAAAYRGYECSCDSCLESRASWQAELDAERYLLG